MSTAQERATTYQRQGLPARVPPPPCQRARCSRGTKQKRAFGGTRRSQASPARRLAMHKHLRSALRRSTDMTGTVVCCRAERRTPLLASAPAINLPTHTRRRWRRSQHSATLEPRPPPSLTVSFRCLKASVRYLAVIIESGPSGVRRLTQPRHPLSGAEHGNGQRQPAPEDKGAVGLSVSRACPAARVLSSPSAALPLWDVCAPPSAPSTARWRTAHAETSSSGRIGWHATGLLHTSLALAR